MLQKKTLNKNPTKLAGLKNVKRGYEKAYPTSNKFVIFHIFIPNKERRNELQNEKSKKKSN